MGAGGWARLACGAMCVGCWAVRNAAYVMVIGGALDMERSV